MGYEENNGKIGPATEQIIDATERLLDLTVLAGARGYPMVVDLEARDSAALIRQGSDTVALDATNARIAKDGTWEITVHSARDAYIAVKQDATDTGTLVGTRIDEDE